MWSFYYGRQVTVTTAGLPLLTSAVLAEGFHPVLLWESSDAAGELHHPGAQTDGEPAASAGKRGQDSVLHGPRHQLLPRGQRHGQDHQRGVGRQAFGTVGVCVTEKCDFSCFLFCSLGRPADWTSIWLVLQRFKKPWNTFKIITQTVQNSTQWYSLIQMNLDSLKAASWINQAAVLK